LRNWIGRYLAHETWHDRNNLWTEKARPRLNAILAELPALDQHVLTCKMAELDLLRSQLRAVVKAIHGIYKRWPRAQRLAQIDGINIVSAVSIAARIGPVGRFASADELIGYAGLAPAVRQSDGTRWNG